MKHNISIPAPVGFSSVCGPDGSPATHGGTASRQRSGGTHSFPALRPLRMPKLPSEGGEPYAPGRSLGDAEYGPLDELEAYQLRERMPIFTGQAPEPSPLGLSTLHTSPKLNREPLPTVSIARNGAYMEVNARQAGVNRAPVGGRRGTVKGFSAAARRRLMRLLASLDRSVIGDVLPLFLTLTYHHNIPADPRMWKRQLSTFCKRVERRYPGVSIIWKLEPQKRGAPHFHLLVFGVDHIPRKWLSAAWNDIVEPGNEAHLRAGTRVERINSWEGVMSYAAKYIGKVHEGFADYGAVGRCWGVRRLDLLPIKVDSISVSWQQFYKLRRVMRAYVEHKRMLGQIRRLPRGVSRRHAVKAARASPRAGRRAWSGIGVFISFEVAMRLLMHVVGA